MPRDSHRVASYPAASLHKDAGLRTGRRIKSKCA
jgi:hypothetical protein